ncbi:MAG TPA: COX15/CtaA family protein [Aestuariivirga sp.]|nr:COX15/CtaA family protein [Aestuariivirga sp.]
MEQTLSPAQAAAPKVRLWLYSMAFLVFCMVIVGGATRLTDSGLSITEWRPLLGAIPPLNEADWLAAFEKYKLIPEYQIQNRGMALSDFKLIYWWEWAHRFLGRFTGLAFALPLIYFTITRRIERTLWPKLLALFVLGGAQGALGWYMVSSGLVDRVDVSQYRLAAHLTLAALIFAAIIWVAKGVGRKRQHLSSSDDRFAILLVALILLQIAAGGFVAGLDAGQGYATWPKMDGQWIPSGLWITSPGWKNIFENAMTVQFNHRVLAYVVLLASIVHVWRSFTLPAVFLACAVFAQACLGVLTLLLHVPLAAALVHQAAAMIVLAAAVWNLHTRLVIRSPDPNPQ